MTTKELEHARAVSMVQQLTAQGHSRRYIAEALTRAGIPTLSGKPGTRWRHQRISELIETLPATERAA